MEKFKKLQTPMTAKASYAQLSIRLNRIMSSWKPDQGTKTQAIGDEVHVEGL